MSIPQSSSKPNAAQVESLWCKGNLNYKLRHEQRDFKREIDNPDKKLIVGNISRRWGKSFTLVLFALEQALKTTQRVRYGAAFKSDLEEFILPAFEQILEDCPRSMRPVYNSSKQTWVFKNGSRIKLVGLDKNPNGLRGNAINVIILDEAAFVSSLKYQYETVIIPATAKQTNIKIVVISTPPESPEHYFVALIAKAMAQDTGFYLCRTIDDISDLTAEERKRLLDEVGGEFSSNAQREFFCKIQIDANRAVVPQFNNERHVSPITPADNTYYWVAGDIGGVRDKSVLFLCAYDYTLKKICIIKEVSFDIKTPTTEIIKESLAMEGGRSLLRAVDAGGQNLVDFNAHGYTCFLPLKQHFEDNVRRLHTAFHNDQILIDPSCKLLIRTLEGGLLNKNHTDYERSPVLGHCDAIAALVYAVRFADTRTPVTPQATTRSEDRFNIRPSKEDDLIEAFKAIGSDSGSDW